MVPSTKIANSSESSEEALENGIASLSLTPAVKETDEETAHGDAESALPNCPEWVAKRFRLPLAQVAFIEVTSASRDLYKTLLEYCAHRAVDIDEPLPKPRKTEDGEPVPYTEREYDGRLSSIWNSPDASFDDGHNRSRRRGGSYFGSFSATDSDTDSDDMFDDGPRMPEYQFGLGWARVEAADGQDIYAHHFAKGAPISISNSPRFYRAIVLFARDRGMARALCDDAVKWRHIRVKNRLAAVPGRFVLYRLVTSGGGMPNWISHGHKRSRALSSIILPHGQLDSIIGDFKEFARKDTRRWYELHGLPYRRSYLFYGPPGVGKTSTIRALAGTLKLSACFLGLTQRDFSNQTLQDALLTIPKPSILVLEDVDVLFNEDRKSETHTALTFSGLLNALDGLVSGEGTLTIMTTNHIQKLDPALIRAGRVDRRFEFGIPSREQIEDLFASFYPKAPRTLAQQFADAVFERPEKEARSIATLQQHFIFTRRSSAEESLKAIPKFFAEYYPYSAHAGDSSIYT